MDLFKSRNVHWFYRYSLWNGLYIETKCREFPEYQNVMNICDVLGFFLPTNNGKYCLSIFCLLPMTVYAPIIPRIIPAKSGIGSKDYFGHLIIPDALHSDNTSDEHCQNQQLITDYKYSWCFWLYCLCLCYWSENNDGWPAKEPFIRICTLNALIKIYENVQNPVGRSQMIIMSILDEGHTANINHETLSKWNE